MLYKIRKRLTYANVVMTLALVFAMKMRKRLTYANVIMTLALVFSMAGGAYAAKREHWLVTSTKQIKPSVLKQLKGYQGPAGPAGKDGTNGKDGAPGEKGANGANGESVVMKPESKGTHCKEGGENFTVSGKTEYTCNGEKGAPGEKGAAGAPWSPNSQLPKGATETGEYALSTTASAEGELKETAISFPVQLAEKPSVKVIHLKEPGSAPCTGSVEKPSAEAPKTGAPNLCIYEGEGSAAHKGGLVVFFAGSAAGGEPGVAGAVLVMPTTKTGAVSGEGSWAVTG